MQSNAIQIGILLVSLLCMTMLLSGCGCEDGKYPKKMEEKIQKEGVEMIDNFDEFRAIVKRIYCIEAKDGLLGGSHEEFIVKMACTDGGSEPENEAFFEMETAEVEEYGGSSDTGCFYGDVGGLQVKCNKGSGVTLSITEEDKLSGDETGQIYLPADMIKVAYHGQQFFMGVELESTSSWDQFWTSGILPIQFCVTDLLTFGSLKAVKAALSVNTIKTIKRMQRGVRNFERVKDKMGECYTQTQNAACGDAKEVFDTIWDAQCIGPEPGGGRYVYTIQLSNSASNALSAIVAVAVAAMTFH